MESAGVRQQARERRRGKALVLEQKFKNVQTEQRKGGDEEQGRALQLS
jgi:hypothetical protein